MVGSHSTRSITTKRHSPGDVIHDSLSGSANEQLYQQQHQAKGAIVASPPPAAASPPAAAAATTPTAGAASSSLKIIMLVVGTWGDVCPFLEIASKLQQDGHQVRFATHPQHANAALSRQLEFYSLGGNPQVLCQYLCKQPQSWTSKDTWQQLLVDFEELLKMMEDIMMHSWLACIDDGNGSDIKAARGGAGQRRNRGSKFDAIIANPLVYSHIHCAEALDIPVHLMFPQPWIGSRSLPHPLMSGSRMTSSKASGGYAERRWMNSLSHVMVDELQWLLYGSMINRLRTNVMGLPYLGSADLGAHLTRCWSIPYAVLCSPHILPPCDDWAGHIDVVGAIMHDDRAVAEYKEREEEDDLSPLMKAWLEKDREMPLVFVTFGSMVLSAMEWDKVLEAFASAAKLLGVRVLLQRPESTNNEKDYQDQNLLCVTGRFPHSQMCPRCNAIVHHGGHGTMMSGLRYGLPTLIIPFFGDQFLWAQTVVKLGVGPSFKGKITDLTPETLAKALNDLLLPHYAQAAADLGRKLQMEGGAVEGAVMAFYRQYDQTLSRSAPRYGRVQPKCLLAGVLQGGRGAFEDIIRGFLSLLLRPLGGGLAEGGVGAVAGVGKGVYDAIYCWRRAVTVLIGKVYIGLVEDIRKVLPSPRH